MAISGVGAVGGIGSTLAMYAASPYLDGVTRVSDAVAVVAARAAQLTPATAIVDAAAAQTTFANPAIADIASRAAVRTQNAANSSPALQLSGDSGAQIQAYGAVALLTGPLGPLTIYGLPPRPAIPPVAPVAAAPRLPRVRAFT